MKSNDGLQAAMGLRALDTSAVQEFARLFERLFDERDYAGMAAYYAEDARLFAEHTAVVRGRSDIERFWKAAGERSDIRRSIEVHQVESSQSLGCAVGVVKLELQGVPDQIKVNYVTVWRFHEDGLWRLTIDISSRAG